MDHLRERSSSGSQSAYAGLGTKSSEAHSGPYGESPYEELTEEELRNKINNEIEKQKTKSRQEYMKQKKEELEKQLQHYSKVKDRWAKADVGIKIIGTITVVLSSVLASVFSAGIPLAALSAGPIISAVLSGIAAVKTALVETVMISLTTKRKKFYRRKCELIKEYINKFYLFYEKSRDDGVITLMEITKFNELLNMFNNAMLSLKLSRNRAKLFTGGSEALTTIPGNSPKIIDFSTVKPTEGSGSEGAPEGTLWTRKPQVLGSFQ